jgi:photosystem II PsbY protein
MIDWRIVAVLLPIALAASWALFNIAAAGISQFQRMLSRKS